MNNFNPYFQSNFSPPPPRPRSRVWVEVAKFMGLFLGFFILLSVVVMGPTLLTSLGYYFSAPHDDFSDKYDLPVRTGADSFGIDELNNFIEQSTFVPDQDTLVIPKINVDAPIVYMQSYDNSQILEDIKHGIGHYYGTALPGRVGNSFMTGHSSYYWWSGGEYNQVFANLDKLQAGDLIYAYHDGDKFVYEVTDKFVIRPSETEVLNQTDKPVMTLMTCTPIGTNLKRLIVQAELVGRPPVDTTDFDEFVSIPELPIILPLY
ncbi:MAG: class D sortase [Patescibacteria group bacterium]|nr:class D sortase [Patescibacteria group bacterium]